MGRQSKIAPSSAVLNQEQISNIRKILKENILGSGMSADETLTKEQSEICALFRRLIGNGESNSALLIGSRGSGKSMLVNNAIAEVKEDVKAFSDCVIVRLNGFVHTDDRLALKEIALQMHLENVVGDEVPGSFAENLTFLLQCLREGNRHLSKSVLFILDEFDLFCHHPNQTLLYNLFDIAQSAQVPICVLGISCRTDVVGLLEKRVLSRFSNRQIHVHPFAHCNESQSVKHSLVLVQSLLSVSADFKSTSNLSEWVIERWNTSIKTLCENLAVKNCIQYFSNNSNCQRIIRNFLLVIVSKLGVNHTDLLPSDFSDTYSLIRQNRRVSIMEGLSVLEFCLLVAMMHHTLIYEDAPFNFEIIFSRLLKFDCLNKKPLNIERAVALKAFEHIQSIELILPSASVSQILKEFRMYRLAVLAEEVREAVNNISKILPTIVVQWASSDFV